MVVKCSRSLFLSHYITLKMVISLCCILLHSEFPERISLCFTDVGIIKTSQETTNFFRTDFFLYFGGFPSYFLKYNKFSKLEDRKIHFSKYKTFFQSGFFHFLRSESSFLKYQKILEGSISGNISKAFF